MALKIGMVGYRGIAKSHTPGYKDNPLGQLVAVADVVPSRADEAAKELGVKPYASLKDMLDAHGDLDIIDVCTGGMENGSWHYEPAMEAMAAGKHVLVEKPISNDIKEAREMVAFAARQNVYLGCNLNHYFTPPAEQAKKLIDEDKIGQVGYCLHKMGFNGGDFTYARDRGPKVDGHPYFHMKAFLTHPFSVMRYFCGDITHVQCFAERPGCRRTAGDVMLSINGIHVRFANGAIGYLLSQRGDMSFGLGGWWSVEVAGTKGTFCIENCIEKMTYWPAPQPNMPAPTPEVSNSGISDFGQTFPRRIQAFMEDVTAGVPKESLRASGRDALAVLEYTWAAIESYEQGGAMVRPQPLPLLKGDPRVM